ncbi:unnamed protein product [Didymodactylos carnosus]|uniref:ADP ribosyltransferase domain-containing protein n=1 Tax=Didymodactylos carnosus TaxID=1234261 RepID=A0A815J8P6_9BILA|nr:unnamed protein product [Didymodactylos carnosus]CAF1374736.1 unnamed protein product [Didymodactylos carnosus]CAF3858009.1 unnamed protein product [Didymodactylos carnosus]CAF4264266.1 unnamed protein product [Didymodactylos carnosus]
MDGPLCSRFYIACRDGDLVTAENELSKLKPSEISRLEPNGSTALHAAAYYGHTEIVRLFVRRCCSRSIRNKYGLTPYEEAKTDEIGELLKRHSGTKRYDKKTIPLEWISDNFDGIWKNLLHPGRLFECGDDSPEKIKARQDCVVRWLEEHLTDKEELELITSWFKLAFENNSAEYLIRAYTEETDFFRKLNQDLANIDINKELSDPEMCAPLIIARTLFRCAYYARDADNCVEIYLYRAVKYDEKEISKYKEHITKGPIKTKTFWSTSKSRKEAENMNKDYNTMLLLKSRDPDSRRTLDIAKLSSYVCEEEVLIVPLTYMQITSVKKKGNKHEIQIVYWDW